MPTFRQLEIFLEAAADCNFRRTADRLNISQPAISKHIGQFEDELGYPLFERIRGHSPTLTAEGLALVPKVRDMLHARKAMVPSTRSAPEEGHVELTLAVRHFLFENDLMTLLSTFLEHHPQISLDVKIYDKTPEIMHALETGLCDIAIYRGSVIPRKVSRIEFLSSMSTSIYAPKGFIQDLTEEMPDFDNMPFLLPPEESEVTEPLLAALHANDIHPSNVVGRSQFPRMLAEWVARGRGVSPLMDMHMRSFLERGLVERIFPLSYKLSTIMALQDKALQPAAKPLLACLRKELGSE
ncbi:LysR family transcriptional regulator [Altericroceibacterium endophyticum]|uniref:LysR family transcriptional regulator n=1 Tax=Altericroceibacterium endophyticum TaxID=1808508 RepID=A0A6I4T6B5_9SPHN|nr:LysR family transcriptional regulator [Altericroceibacterium endophyticum]MXO66218.1 LysR family transcriptional regulator [Altericroceibacterium endophyticum]